MPIIGRCSNNAPVLGRGNVINALREVGLEPMCEVELKPMCEVGLEPMCEVELKPMCKVGLEPIEPM